MADFSNVEYTSELDSISSKGHTHFSGPHLRQNYHQEIDVQILDHLTPENEPPGTSVYSFSEGGDFDMQIDFIDKPSGLENHGAEQEDDIGMDVGTQDLSGWIWQDQEGDISMDRQVASEGKCLRHLVKADRELFHSSQQWYHRVHKWISNKSRIQEQRICI